MKSTHKSNGGFGLADAPSYLIKRCLQYYGDLYMQETGNGELTRQQFMVLTALESNDGVSQTALVEITGIDRSTLAEMVRRLLERGLLSRKRTAEDARANAISISAAGKRALRTARNAADRAEKAFLEPVPAADRAKFLKALAAIAEAGDAYAAGDSPNIKKKKPVKKKAGKARATRRKA